MQVMHWHGLNCIVGVQAYQWIAKGSFRKKNFWKEKIVHIG